MPGNSVTLQFDGLAEFKAALRALPKEFVQEGSERIDDTVEVTSSRLIQSYPKGDTGNLRRGVRRSIESGTFGTVGIVKSTSPHAHLWEFWHTKPQNQTRLGAWASEAAIQPGLSRDFDSRAAAAE